MHETPTANINNLGVSGLRKVSTFNQNINGLISMWHRNPRLLILTERSGLEVDIFPVNKINSLDAYDSEVNGTAVS